MAWLFLGEPWHLSEFVSASVGVIGVVLIARPTSVFGSEAPMVGRSNGDDSTRYFGVACCVIGTLCAGMSFVMVRLLGTRVKVHWSLVMLYQAAAQVVLAIPCLLFGQVPVALTFRMAFVAVVAGLAGSLGQSFNTWAMQREKAATASLVQKSLSPFLGFLNQVMFLPSDPVYLTTIIGYFFTGVSLAIVSIGKLRHERASDEQGKVTDGYEPLPDGRMEAGSDLRRAIGQSPPRVARQCSASSAYSTDENGLAALVSPRA
eukprot:CAMPEP_0117504204 /NCGR_PEP_ID=MMETSP0784-20121206/24729_1 /TAXON_ID=39447 /ORGANISM="" /LENGTH=260 /DNA_ID=CAMNT_0005299553 /DNA_START=402 /DNA_END=1184 /DNA_ORIENTATION=+